MYKSLAIFTGIVITIMVSMNGLLSELVGQTTANIFIHLLGLSAATVIFILTKQYKNNFSNIPAWMFTGGMLGAVLLYCNNTTFIEIGASMTIALALFGQTIFSCIIDHYGFFGMNKVEFKKSKIVGFGIILTGIIMMGIAG